MKDGWTKVAASFDPECTTWWAAIRKCMGRVCRAFVNATLRRSSIRQGSRGRGHFHMPILSPTTRRRSRCIGCTVQPVKIQPNLGAASNSRIRLYRMSRTSKRSSIGSVSRACIRRPPQWELTCSPAGVALDAVPVMDSRVGLALSLILKHAHLGRRWLEVLFDCSPIPELITLRQVVRIKWSGWWGSALVSRFG